MSIRPRSSIPERGTGTPADGREGVLLSVIIVNWNVRELLCACLASLHEQSLMKPEQLQVIVVDNASDDGSVDAVRSMFPSVTVIANDQNVGFGRANNQALPLCRGSYVLLLNPDTVVLDHAVDRLLRQLEPSTDVGAMACRLVNSDGSFQRWTAGGFPSVKRAAVHALCLDRLLPARWRPESMYLSDDVDSDVDVDWVSGACMLLRREAIHESIFDESYFMYGEDTDLCDRLHRGGWRVVYSPCATVLHHAGRSMNQQSGNILLTSFKGPRQFYRTRNGSITLVAYDLMVATGFLARTVAYAVLAVTRRNQVTWARAVGSWGYTRRAVRVMIGQ